MRISKEKFAELIREFKLPMYRLSYGILQNEMDAEDAVGEAVIKAYEHLDSLRESDKFRQWIMMITANEAKHIFRKRKRVELTEDVSRYGMSQNDKYNELWDVILTLDEKYRSVIILYYYDQMKIKEISKILHITEGTVKSRLSRAKEYIKETAGLILKGKERTMIDNFDEKIMKRVRKEAGRTPKLPQNFDVHIENILNSLPAGKKRRLTWKKALILAAALAAALSVTVTAAVNYARQRMEAMDEAERTSHFQASLNISPADFYSRELTDTEKMKMKELKEKYYNEGVFPERSLKRIETASEYDGYGVAFLASRGTFFLPEKELSDEEILQIIDFREKREFSIHEAELRAAAGELDSSAYDAVYEPVQIELTAQDKVINYSGEMRIDAAAAFGNTLYIGEKRSKANENQAYLYQMELDSDTPVKMEVQVPDGMDICRMTTDGKGNLCILLTRSENGTFENIRSYLWKLSPEGKELERTDITQISGTEMSYQAIAADKDGRIYLAQRKGAGKNQRILVLNEDFSLAGSIACDDGDIRGLGRAGTGEVYGVLMAGDEWIPAVVGFDINNFTIDEKYSNVLPADVGAFDTMGAGTNSDLLIWGPCGIFTYNIGDEKASAARSQYELPDGAAICFVPGSRALFISNNYTVKDGIMDFDNYQLEKIYLMKAE